MAASAAYAQNTPAPAASGAAPAPATQLITISGSRIKRDTFSTSAPVQIIRNEDAAVAGFTSAAEVLQGTSVTGGQGQINNAFGGFVTEGGPGSNTVGLRGFAPTRSLVLLNGRRLAPSGTRGSVGAADLNTIPSFMVDRIEVLKDGASSIYGSDAVAGVINIITKRNIEGIRVDGQFTQSQDGGGDVRSGSLVGGFTAGPLYVTAAYQYQERTNLTLGDRDWTRCNTDYRRTTTGGVLGEWGSADYIDPKTGAPKCYPITGTGSNGVTINTLGTVNFTGVGAPGSVGTTFNRWRPNPAITTGFAGYEGVGGGQTTNLNVRDTFDPRTLNRSLISPANNHNVLVQGGVELPALGGAELYFELLYNRRDSEQTGFRQLSLDYAVGSPLLPAGIPAGTFLPASGSLISNGRNIQARAFIGFGNDTSSQTVDFTRALTGLRGAIGKTGWDYDVVASTASSKGKYTSESWLTDRLAQSLNVVANGTGFSCVNTANGCVAAPRLTTAVIGGQLPADWIAYTFVPVTGTTKYKESVVTASATGDLFAVPAGKVKAAVGVEVRRFSIDDSPPPDSVAGNLYNLTTSAITRGSDSAQDVFGEVEVPLLKNAFAAKELTFNFSSRLADYKSYGTGSTYKAGMVWAPNSWLTFRGTTGTSYRAPAVFEQFLGPTSGFISQQSDPCTNYGTTAGISPIRQANCASEGLPANFVLNQSIAVISSGGKDAGLKAETSVNKNFGIILQPALPAGAGELSVALDFFDIEVDNGVSRAGATNILQLCYDSPDFRAGGGFCRLINPRAAGTNGLTVNDSYVNLATDIVRGRDFSARYSNKVGPGNLRLNLSVTKFSSQASKLFAEDPLVDVNGRLTRPKYSGNLDVNYNIDSWRLYYGLDYVGSQDSYAANRQDPATSAFKLSVPEYYRHTASVGYRGNKWDVTVGVRNLTDVEPPQISSGFNNRVGNAPLYSGYDFIGRTFFLNVGKSF